MSTNTIPTLERISRERLAELVRAKQPGLTIVDVRDDDFIGGHIAGCQNVPTSTHDHAMPELVRTLKDQDTVVFHCALSQQRGPASALRYLREKQRLTGGGSKEAKTEKEPEGTENEWESKQGEGKAQKVYVLDGGFTKWQEVFVMYLAFNDHVQQLTTNVQIWRGQESDRRLSQGAVGGLLNDSAPSSQGSNPIKCLRHTKLSGIDQRKELSAN